MNEKLTEKICPYIDKKCDTHAQCIKCQESKKNDKQ